MTRALLLALLLTACGPAQMSPELVAGQQASYTQQAITANERATAAVWTQAMRATEQAAPGATVLAGTEQAHAEVMRAYTRTAAASTQLMADASATAVPAQWTQAAQDTAVAWNQARATENADAVLGQARLDNAMAWENGRLWLSLCGLSLLLVGVPLCVCYWLVRRADAMAAEPEARAREIDQRQPQSKSLVTSDGGIWQSRNGKLALVGKVVVGDAAPALPRQIERADAPALTMHAPEAGELVDFLAQVVTVAGADSRIIPRHDKLGMGGETRTMLVRRLRLAGIADTDDRNRTYFTNDYTAGRALAEIRAGLLVVPMVEQIKAPV